MPKRQRIEGTIYRAFPLSLSKREAAMPGAVVAEDDAATDALLADNLILEFPFSSEEPYLRNSWWDNPWVETLGHTEDECDLTRLMDGAPVLLNHGQNTTEDSPLKLVGTTVKAWLDGMRGMVQIKLSRRDGMEGLVQDIQDGIVRNISVGYQILERTAMRMSAARWRSPVAAASLIA